MYFFNIISFHNLTRYIILLNKDKILYDDTFSDISGVIRLNKKFKKRRDNYFIKLNAQDLTLHKKLLYIIMYIVIFIFLYNKS